MKTDLKVGDTAWWASNGVKEVTRPCPVCFGKLSVTVILGNDEAVTTPCDYCGKGYAGPTGVEKEWEWVAETRCVTISGMSIEDDGHTKRVRYQAYGGYHIEAADLYATKEEAEAGVAVRIEEHQAEELKRRDHLKEYAHKNFAWHVGYHRKQVKNHERQLEWHKARVIACTKHSKTPVSP